MTYWTKGYRFFSAHACLQKLLRGSARRPNFGTSLTPRRNATDSRTIEGLVGDRKAADMLTVRILKHLSCALEPLVDFRGLRFTIH